VRQAARSGLVRYAPPAALARLRSARRSWRRTRHTLEHRVRPVTITRGDIVDALREAGVDRAPGVFVQTAMSAFGHVEGGAATVLEALDETLRPDALLVMPAFSLAGDTSEYPDVVEFDVRATPSLMGAITERFRRAPGVVRSLHPTHSVSARGPGADELVAAHADAETPFGPGTPFARMVERDLLQVWFGCGVGPFTIYHAFECGREGGFPLPVFWDRQLHAVCVDAHGVAHEVSTLVHDPILARRRVDTDPRVEARLRALLLEAGVLRRVGLGRGEILVAPMGALMDELERLLERGITIYDVELAAAGAHA
jgi:aminoglycoside 3-N-acetyltransferase